ncbi:MAG: hypothetical protein ABL907_06290 [Hyphomicrobium sp.]
MTADMLTSIGVLMQVEMPIVLGAVAIFLAVTLHLGHAYMDSRIDQLQLAREALRKHFEAATSVVTDPKSPEIIVHSINELSWGVGRRELADAFAKCVDARKASPLKVSTDIAVFRAQITQAVDALRREDESRVLDEFKIAVEMGLFSMALRWPSVMRPALDKLRVGQADTNRTYAHVGPEAELIVPVAAAAMGLHAHAHAA